MGLLDIIKQLFTTTKDFVWPAGSEAEPSSVRRPKKVAKLILTLGVAGYFVWECLQLSYNDVTVNTSRERVNSISMPILEFNSAYNFSISTTIGWMPYGYQVLPDFGPYKVDNITDYYVARFNQHLEFAIPTAQPDELNGTISMIAFAITIQDQFFSATSSDALLTVNLFDADTEQISLNPGGQPRVVSDYLATLFNANYYLIAKGFNTYIGVARSIRNVLLPDVRNLIVGQPTYVDINMLSTTYGADRVGAPWGLWQKLPFIKREIRKDLDGVAESGLFEAPEHIAGEYSETNEREIPPKEDETPPPEREKEIPPGEDETPISKLSSLEARQDAMEKRQIALEVFLKDYVLEVDYIRDD
ncbi:2881_t:CDS:2 [Paraglomus occultum]|uniref:2881_t:CDS:1 n=1 Tax=Paraglomus occultum TaxID=144539 RepID=A0A9N9BM44_9GLOM|nr:2881_t:CDS:2 [Paraglomus occultum]